MIKIDAKLIRSQLTAIVALILVLFHSASIADPLPQGLSVSAQIERSPLSIAPKGDALQTATIRLRSEETVLVGDQVTTGALPLSGTLSDVGDSLVIDTRIAGGGPGAAAGVLFNIDLKLANSSANATYILRFQIHGSHTLITSGDDAVADISCVFVNDATQKMLLTPWKFASDSYFNNQYSPISKSEVFEINLAPGKSAWLKFAIDLQGDTNLFGLSGPDDHFVGTARVGLVLNEVQLMQIGGEAIPIPTLSVWGLLLLSILLTLLIGRRPRIGEH